MVFLHSTLITLGIALSRNAVAAEPLRADTISGQDALTESGVVSRRDPGPLDTRLTPYNWHV